MGNLQLYTILLAVVGGNLQAEEQEIDWNRTANAQQVDTVAKGFAGMSPGSPMVEVDIHGAMPAGGFEFDAGPYIASLTPIAIQVIGPGGKTMKGDAIIVSDNGRHGVNQQARYSFRCIMAIQQFK